MSGLSGHTTNDPGMICEFATDMLKDLSKANSLIKNKKLWVYKQFHSLYKSDCIMLDLTYGENQNEFGEIDMNNINPNYYIVTTKGNKILNELLSGKYNVKFIHQC